MLVPSRCPLQMILLLDWSWCSLGVRLRLQWWTLMLLVLAYRYRGHLGSRSHHKYVPCHLPSLARHLYSHRPGYGSLGYKRIERCGLEGLPQDRHRRDGAVKQARKSRNHRTGFQRYQYIRSRWIHCCTWLSPQNHRERWSLAHMRSILWPKLPKKGNCLVI